MTDVSPAAEISQAASHIRELARKATLGPWLGDVTGTVVAAGDVVLDGSGREILPPEGPSEIAECYRSERPGERGSNAEHIALWDPVVAYLVARLLDEAAPSWTELEAHNAHCSDGLMYPDEPDAAMVAAMELARAINAQIGQQ